MWFNKEPETEWCLWCPVMAQWKNSITIMWFAWSADIISVTRCGNFITTVAIFYFFVFKLHSLQTATTFWLYFNEYYSPACVGIQWGGGGSNTSAHSWPESTPARRLVVFFCFLVNGYSNYLPLVIQSSLVVRATHKHGAGKYRSCHRTYT